MKLTTSTGIQGAEDSQLQPEWRRKDARALIASTAGVHIVLDSIGAPLEYMEDCQELYHYFVGYDFKDGVHVVDFHLEHYKLWTYYGYDYDEEVIIDECRLATEEEMQAHRDGEYPWDPTEWMSNWEEFRKFNNFKEPEND
jgi:hypothetical protein